MTTLGGHGANLRFQRVATDPTHRVELLAGGSSKGFVERCSAGSETLEIARIDGVNGDS
jgi:hypothetical protein